MKKLIVLMFSLIVCTRSLCEPVQCMLDDMIDHMVLKRTALMQSKPKQFCGSESYWRERIDQIGEEHVEKSIIDFFKKNVPVLHDVYTRYNNVDGFLLSALSSIAKKNSLVAAILSRDTLSIAQEIKTKDLNQKVELPMVNVAIDYVSIAFLSDYIHRNQKKFEYSTLAQLLQADANPNAAIIFDGRIMPLLFFGILLFEPEALQLLIMHGANPNPSIDGLPLSTLLDNFEKEFNCDGMRTMFSH